jgi:hypothetical protein
MVAHLTTAPAALAPDPEPAADTDPSVEPVERVSGAGTAGTRPPAHDRIRLQLRVAALEVALARARRRRARVVEHYERVLDRREGDGSPEFSWRD